MTDHPEVDEAEYSAPNQLVEMARRYAREIVPRFSAFVYFGFAIWLAKVLSRGFYRVRLGAFDEAVMGNPEFAAELDAAHVALTRIEREAAAADLLFRVVEECWGDLPTNELRMMLSENAAKLYRHPLPEVVLPLD